jgi:sugar phosphate isomerase/epimerase
VVDRRSFLKAAVTVPFLARAAVATGQDRVSPVGLQLYTVRAELQKNFDGTLATVAAVGYREVELAFVEDLARSPQQIRTALRSSGLAGVSSHVRFGALGNRWPEAVDAARAIGQKFIVINSLDAASRVQPDIWQRASERLNRAGEVCRTAGLQLAYHNHLFEFASLQGTSKRPYDILLESTDPSLVSMQMDLCWFVAAGQDPATYFKRYPGRYSSVHVKDLKRLPLWTEPIRVTTVSSELSRDLADVGQGVIDWPTTLGQCWSTGIRHYYVEHDNPEAPVDSIRRSFAYLRGMRFNTAAR